MPKHDYVEFFSYIIKRWDSIDADPFTVASRNYGGLHPFHFIAEAPDLIYEERSIASYIEHRGRGGL